MYFADEQIHWKFNLRRWGGQFERLLGSSSVRFTSVLEGASFYSLSELVQVVLDAEIQLNYVF